MSCLDGTNTVNWDITKTSSYSGDYRNCDIEKVRCTGDYGGYTTFYTSSKDTTCQLKEVVCDNKTTNVENLPPNFSAKCHINTLLCGSVNNKNVFTFIPSSSKYLKYCVSSYLFCDGRPVSDSPHYYDPSSSSCSVSSFNCPPDSSCSYWYNDCLNSTFCEYKKYSCIDACQVPVKNLNYIFYFILFFIFFF